MRRRIAALAVLLAAAPSLAHADAPSEADKERNRRPLLIVMNEVVDGLWPKIKAAPAPESRPLSAAKGLVGLGAFAAPGGDDFGVGAPPRLLFPRVGAGNSLGVDPTTGRSYWTHMP
jgi:hypothetical protein